MLYVLFGSRAGLPMAMVDHPDARSGAGERLASLRTEMPPAQAFEPYLRAWFDYLPEVLPVADALSAAAARGDADAAAAWGSRMDKLRAGFTLMTRAFRAAGVLKAGWTPSTSIESLPRCARPCSSTRQARPKCRKPAARAAARPWPGRIEVPSCPR